MTSHRSPLQRIVSLHTPGSWEREGTTVFALNRRDYNRWVTTVHAGHDDEDQRVSAAECEAIARVIEASPDLLEACQQAARYLDPAKYPDAVRAVDAAIAKALGVQANANSTYLARKG